MKYRELIDRSTLVVTGCIGGNVNEYLNELDCRLYCNKIFYDKFDKLVVHYNKINSEIKDSEFEEVRDIYKKYFPDCIFLSSHTNRGWIFGGIDSLKTLYSYVVNNIDVDYVWFATDDFLLKENFLDIDFGDEEYDFFGLPFFGIGGIEKDTKGTMDVDIFIKKYKKDYLLPQYSFHITRTDAITFFLMLESDEADSRYNKWVKSDINDQREFTVSTERLLCETIEKNKLNCKLIIEDIEPLVTEVINFNIIDGAHKNIFFTEYGLCHWAFFNEQVLCLGEGEARLASVKITREGKERWL